MNSKTAPSDTTYPIEIAEYNSAGIREIAEQIGAPHMRRIGAGSTAVDPGPDDWTTFFAIPYPNGAEECRVADTSGDPIWEDEDAEAFANLAGSCGVTL